MEVSKLLFSGQLDLKSICNIVFLLITILFSLLPLVSNSYLKKNRAPYRTGNLSVLRPNSVNAMPVSWVAYWKTT